MTEKISYAIFKSFFPYNTPASAKRLYLSAKKKNHVATDHQPFPACTKKNKYCLLDPIFATKIKSVSLMGKQNLQAPHSKLLGLKH